MTLTNDQNIIERVKRKIAFKFEWKTKWNLGIAMQRMKKKEKMRNKNLFYCLMTRENPKRKSLQNLSF